jgi:uncharacterized protein YoxC
MLLANAIVGLFQLLISIIFAVLALYIGFAVLSKITKVIDEEMNSKKEMRLLGFL